MRNSARTTRPLTAAATALLLAALTVLLPLIAAPPARAADNGRWSVFPARARTAAEPYFHFTAEPGTVLHDKVTVANLSAAPMAFAVYGADAYNTPRDGGFAVRTRDEKQTGIGVWTKVATGKVTLPAHGRTTVPFTVTVPADAEPGDHVGAVVALDQRVAPARNAVGMGVRQAVAARVYLRVGGQRKASVRVDGVHLDYAAPMFPGIGGDKHGTLTYTLVNDGNVTLRPRVELTAKGLFGRTLLSREARTVPAELLPGEHVLLTETWKSPPLLDRGKLTVTVTDQGAGLYADASTSFLVAPWALVGLVVLAVLCGAGWAVLRVRVRRGPAASAVVA